MKRYFSLILIFTLLFVFISPNANAFMRERTNRTPSPDIYQEHVYDIKTYFTDRRAYETARDQYKAYQTAQSKENAFDMAKEMLESSRLAMISYINMIQNSLRQQEPVNSRVQNAIINDLTTHLDYLTNAKKTITDSSTLEQVSIASEALTLRYRYLRITSSQALSYIDAVTAKTRNDQANDIVDKFSNIISGYPEDNRPKLIVQKWAEEMYPELAFNQEKIIQFLDALYPTPENLQNKTYFEFGSEGPNNTPLREIIIKQRGYTAKFKEMEGIAKDAYQSL